MYIHKYLVGLQKDATAQVDVEHQNMDRRRTREKYQ